MNTKIFKDRLTTFTVGVLLAVLILALNLSAQNIPMEASDQASQIKAEMNALPLHMQKLNSNVYKVLKRIETADITRTNIPQYQMAEEFSNPFLDVDDQGRFHLTLRTAEITPSLLSDIQNLEFEIEATTKDLNVTANHQMISGWAPFYQIEELAKIAEVFHIRNTDKPLAMTGDVNTAGDGILRADLARSTFAVDGSGETVGVISDGVDNRASSQASNDLPATINVINNRFGGDEGTAMLEIVHDLAPGANLAFADFANSQADFANNIMLLQGAGSTIITDDIIYLLEPVYEDGVIAQTVDNVVNINDVVYTSSSNNQQLDHYEGDFSSPDGDVWHDFVSGDETIDLSLGGFRQIRLVLEWNNAFGLSSDDYDLFLYDASITTVLASSEDIQNGNDDPVEFLSYTNPSGSTVTVHIAVKRTSGAARNLSIYTYGTGVTPNEHVGGDGAVYGHAGAISNLAVGAIDASDPGNDDIEPFSNHGPTRIYTYDGSGNPISFFDRGKPAHAAIDGVQTKVGQLGFFSNPFFGTSAATPHTAGVAALVREAAPALSAIQVGSVLNNTAVDLGTPGFDYVFGNGRIDAFNAVSSVAGVPGPIVFFGYTIDDDNSGNSSGNGDGIINPGETIELYVDLYNPGTGTASAVNACIAELSPYVNGMLFNTCSNYGDIASSSSATNSDDFDFAVDPATPDQHQINFTLDITSTNGGPWTVSFFIPVVAQAPLASVNPPTLTFNVPIGGMDTQTLTIDNTGAIDLSWNLGESEWSGTSLARSTDIDHLRMKENPELKFEDITGPPFFRNTFMKLAEGLGFSLNTLYNSNRASRSIIFFDDMEGGVGGWTTTLVGSVDDLWHQTNSNSNSPSTSWWCGDESLANYNTGNRINTILVSPMIDLSTASAPVTLQFYESFETEFGWDYCMVDVSTDGGSSWFHLRGSSGHDTAPSGNSGGWILSALDLTPFIGQQINLGFYFDTVDPIGNAFPGWFVDDVLVFDNGVTDVVPWLSENPLNGTITTGGSQIIDVSVNAGTMLAGTYRASLAINNNDFDNNPLTVPIELNIASTTPPDIDVVPSSFTFTVPVGGATSDLLTISNTASPGSDALLWNITEQDVTVILKDGTQIPVNLGIEPSGMQNVNLRQNTGKKSQRMIRKQVSFETPFTSDASTTSNGRAPALEGGFIPSSPLVANVLFIETTNLTNSVSRALNELGVAYDYMATSDFTTIDFTPYSTIIIGMDGGSISEASVQAVANEAASGKNLIMLGGTNITSYYTGVQNHLLQHDGTTGWVISSIPHLTVTNTAHPLAPDLSSPYNYVDPAAAFYMLRITDPAASVAAVNGDGFPALVSKSIGSGNLVYSISSPYGSYYANEPDFQVLKTIIRNAINMTNCPWLSENPASGITAPGSSDIVTINVDASGLAIGTYDCELLISSNDPDENPVIVPVTLNVGGTAPQNLYAFDGYHAAVPLAWDPPSGYPPFNPNGLSNLESANGSIQNAGSISGGLNKMTDKRTFAETSNSPSQSPDQILQYYNIYRSTNPGGPYAQIATGITRQYYRDMTVNNGVTYYYVVTAQYDVGESNNSNEFAATPVLNGYVINSGFASAPPTLDGSINSAEWSSAIQTDITGSGVPNPVTLYTMNDGNFLYLAVDDPNNTSPEDLDQLGLYFDEDHNYEWPMSSPSGEGNFWVQYFMGGPVTDYRGISGWWPANLVFDPSATAAGVNQAIDFSSGHAQFEVEIDLSASELNSAPGSDIGLYMFSYDAAISSFLGNWPTDISPFAGGTWSGPFSYGTVTLATPPITPTAGLLYASTGNPGGMLITIDPFTGAGTPIAPHGAFGPVTEIEFRGDSVLFGATGQGFSNIITIDPATGGETLIGTHPFGSTNGLEFDGGGNLLGTFYDAGGTGLTDLVIVDQTTGNFATVIGPTSINKITGLALHPNGTLYGSGHSGGGGNPSNLYTIDPATGAATPVGAIGFDNVGALEFGPDGVLYGGVGATGGAFAGHLITIDPATGAGTDVGPSGFPGISGLSFYPGEMDHVDAYVFCPPSAPQGCPITTEIKIDMTNVLPPDDLLGSFTGTLTWDPTLLDYVSNSGILSGYTGIVNVDAPNGIITFNGAKPTGTAGVVDILNIDFDVIGPVGATATLDLEFSAMAAAFTFNNLLPILTVHDCTMDIIQGGLLGDVNDDGAVNSTDALIILSYDAGLPLPQPFLDRINAGFGDVNSDGNTNSTDALIVLSYDVGIPVPFPVGQPFCP